MTITILYEAYVKGQGKPASLEHPQLRVMGDLAAKSLRKIISSNIGAIL